MRGVSIYNHVQSHQSHDYFTPIGYNQFWFNPKDLSDAIHLKEYKVFKKKPFLQEHVKKRLRLYNNRLIIYNFREGNSQGINKGRLKWETIE